MRLIKVLKELYSISPEFTLVVYFAILFCPQVMLLVFFFFSTLAKKLAEKSEDRKGTMTLNIILGLSSMWVTFEKFHDAKVGDWYDKGTFCGLAVLDVLSTVNSVKWYLENGIAINKTCRANSKITQIL